MHRATTSTALAFAPLETSDSNEASLMLLEKFNISDSIKSYLAQDTTKWDI